MATTWTYGVLHSGPGEDSLEDQLNAAATDGFGFLAVLGPASVIMRKSAGRKSGRYATDSA